MQNPGASPQTPLGWFTVPPTALCDFHFAKIINIIYGFCPSKVWPSDRAAIHIHLFFLISISFISFKFPFMKYISFSCEKLYLMSGKTYTYFQNITKWSFHNITPVADTFYCFLSFLLIFLYFKWNLSGLRRSFGNWKSFKNDEKCFVFRLKISFLSQDIEIFVLTFRSYRKSSLIRKKSLISNLWRHNVGNNCNSHIAQYLKK